MIHYVVMLSTVYRNNKLVLLDIRYWQVLYHPSTKVNLLWRRRTRLCFSLRSVLVIVDCAGWQLTPFTRCTLGRWPLFWLSADWFFSFDEKSLCRCAFGFVTLVRFLGILSKNFVLFRNSGFLRWILVILKLLFVLRACHNLNCLPTWTLSRSSAVYWIKRNSAA